MQDRFENFLPLDTTTTQPSSTEPSTTGSTPGPDITGSKVKPQNSCNFTEDACITIGGPSNGVPCVFPFKFRGATYFTCANFMGGVACATAVDTDRKPLANQWGYCGPTCPQPQGKDLSINEVSLMNCRLYLTASTITI